MMMIPATPGIPEAISVRDARRRTRTALLLSCAMWLTTASQVAAQRVPDEWYYEAVLDRVFRAPTEKDEGELSLRFLDIEGGEMEIAIRFHPTEFDVVVTALASGQASVWTQLSRLPDAVRLPPVDEVAPLVKIRRGSIRVSRSSNLGKLLASGTRLRMNLEPSPFIFLHGGLYGLTMKSSAKDMRVKLYGPRDPARSAEPVVRWMGRVRQAVQRALPAEQLAPIAGELNLAEDVPSSSP